MYKAIMVSITLLISILFTGAAGCLQAYADEGKSPVTLTKEAESCIDYKDEEDSVPNTGERMPVTVALCGMVLAGTIGVTTVATTAGNHKNS